MNKTYALLSLFAVIVLAVALIDTPKSNLGDLPTVTATATPTATPDKVTSTTAPASEQKPPGFEAVFAIAGLLAVAYLVLRQRK